MYQAFREFPTPNGTNVSFDLNAVVLFSPVSNIDTLVYLHGVMPGVTIRMAYEDFKEFLETNLAELIEPDEDDDLDYLGGEENEHWRNN